MAQDDWDIVKERVGPFSRRAMEEVEGMTPRQRERFIRKTSRPGGKYSHYRDAKLNAAILYPNLRKDQEDTSTGCSAFTMFACLDDMLEEGYGNRHEEIDAFRSAYTHLSGLGPEGVIGMDANIYGVLQLNNIKTEKKAGECRPGMKTRFFGLMQGPVYQGLVDIVYRGDDLGFAVAWDFMHTSKGVWQASLDAQTIFLAENKDYREKAREAASTAMDHDVRADAFYRGTEEENLRGLYGAALGRKNSRNLLYVVASAYQEARCSRRLEH